MGYRGVVLLVAVLVTCVGWAQPDWSEGASIPEGGRPNPYGFNKSDFSKFKRAGALHTLNYPIESTGILLPYNAIKNFIEGTDSNFLTKILKQIFDLVIQVDSVDDFYAWVGLPKYPEEEGSGAFFVPFPEDKEPTDRMGVTRMEKFGATGFTYSCVACHSGQLFGQPVIGMTNRFPRAFGFFDLGKKGMNAVGPKRFKLLTGATPEEQDIFKFTRDNVKAVGTKRVAMPGLDNSLAHTALSLARRNKDAYATKNRHLERFPRREPLKSFMAESKPAVWWNLKYKNRWLLDGSMISGDPVKMVLLVNEVGRGMDLKELEEWVENNPKKIQELTTGIFSTEAPHITDFFPAEKIDINLARRGQEIFENRCAKCHGHYEKNWDREDATELSLAEQMRTFKVHYHEKTPVKDVGTDPQRRMGMLSLMQMNDLSYMKKFGIRSEVQKGYVPPPLVGIWARWPYLHNNSIPNLCALLTPEEKRPMEFYVGEPIIKETDFDFACNGYPLGDDTPIQWRRPKTQYRAGGPGLSNRGHRMGTDLSSDDKIALIQFLQTL